MKRIITMPLVVVAMVLGVLGVTTGAAFAHTPSHSESCSGVTVSGVSYESRDTNTLGVQIDSGAWTTKTFSTSGTLTVAVPQDGVTHTFHSYVHTTNSNPAYSKNYSGTVGPCGNIRNASAAIVTFPADCDSDGFVAVSDATNAELVGVLDQTVGDHNAVFSAVQGHAFSDGSTTLTLPYTIVGATGDCHTAALKAKAFSGCVKARRHLQVVKRVNIESVVKTHNADKTRWVLKGQTKTGTLMHAGKNGRGKWVSHVRWVFNTPKPRVCSNHPHSS